MTRHRLLLSYRKFKRNKSSFVLVILAIVVGIPVGYFAVQRWLENFAYGIELQWSYFLLAGIIVVLVAWFTVGLQTIKAATMNPAKVLRTK